MLFVAPEPVGLPPLQSIDADREALAGRFGERLTAGGPRRHLRRGSGGAAPPSVGALQQPCRTGHERSRAGHRRPAGGRPHRARPCAAQRSAAQRSYSGEFAFLSACQTAVGGIELIDEAITLASALHIAGFRHVIGTLWSVYDGAPPTSPGSSTQTAPPRPADRGPRAADFDPADAARHLHRAVRAMRDRDRSTLTTWVHFVHIGP
ncbi:CHAT domain-containing protein [Streptomyces sp. NPDC090036]|uniref:CHAT domain-containing protein n=1 Tax=Streptomyces sp. NPDC090036 TaxID=3365926 RepID=UPI0037F1185E